MNDNTTPIDTRWLDFLDTGNSVGFLDRIGQTQDEYVALLMALLPEKSPANLEQEQHDFLQLRENTKQETRQKEVLEFAEQTIYGYYEQFFLYRDGGDSEWVQICWESIGDALSRLSEIERETAIEHCKSMSLVLEEKCPTVVLYKGARDFFKDFDFRSDIPDVPSRYVPGESLMKNQPPEDRDSCIW